MNSLWTFEGALAQLPELIDAAVKNGPQTITRDGDPLVVVVSSHEWEGVVTQEATGLDLPRHQIAGPQTFAGNLKGFICG